MNIQHKTLHYVLVFCFVLLSASKATTHSSVNIIIIQKKNGFLRSLNLLSLEV
jgi:hypothetical protein